MARNLDPALPFRPLRRLLGRLRGPASTDPRPGDGRRPSPDPAQRARVQVGVIRRALEDVAAAPSDGSSRVEDDADAAYLFRADHALVRAARLEDVNAHLRDRSEDFTDFDGELARVGTPVAGVVLVKMPQRADRGDAVLATLDEIDRALPEDRTGLPIASPDHVVYVTARAAYCPATEPEMPTARRATPWPPPGRSRRGIPLGDPVRVAVVDTGLWMAAVGSPRSPWLEVGEVVADADDEEHVDPADIHPYGGHGTFVAGVVRCVAPDAQVDVEGALVHGGAVYESDIVAQLQEALEGDFKPQIISLSAGTHTRGDFASLGFGMFGIANELPERDDVLLVAAAGNDASTKPFWPAAFPWVVSVGSVDPSGAVSDFSNTGPWVDVYARGRDLVNAFPKGTYKCYEPPNVGQLRTFDGLARWSGTSFATPVVTGLIAARVQQSKGTESVRAAWAAIRKAGTQTVDQSAGQITRVGPLT